MGTATGPVVGGLGETTGAQGFGAVRPAPRRSVADTRHVVCVQTRGKRSSE